MASNQASSSANSGFPSCASSPAFFTASHELWIPFSDINLTGPARRPFGSLRPGFASPSTFPSRGFSPPQGFTSCDTLWPCFMPLPLLGFYHLRSFSHVGSRDRLRPLALLTLQDHFYGVFDDAWIHRSEVITIQHLAMPLSRLSISGVVVTERIPRLFHLQRPAWTSHHHDFIGLAINVGVVQCP